MINRLPAFALLFLPLAALAQDFNAQREAMNMVADFAEKICKMVPLEGQTNNVQLNGQAKAELSGLIKKVANLGVEGAAKYESAQYQGPLQKDLATIIKDSRDCRLAIWNDLKEKIVFGIKQTTKECRIPANGLEYYLKQERWSSDSGWRGGGSSPSQFCGSAKLDRESTFPDRKVELLASGEDHRSIYNPFKHDEYRYTCTFQDNWEPVFKLASSDKCK